MGNKLYNLIIRRRSIRLFKQREVPLPIIKRAINAGRLAPSAANLQFLEYLVVTEPSLCKKIFPHTRWAGYLYPKRVPPPAKRPTFYILILINKERFRRGDSREVGAAAENIILSLLAEGIGTCWIGCLKKRALKKILNISNKYKLDSLIAAGYPAERPKLETDSKGVKYWLDRKGRLHVPKRPLRNVLHYNRIA